MQAKSPSEKSGFSLIELVVVILIIGILGTVAFQSYARYRMKIKVAEAQLGIDTLSNHQIAYHAEYKEFNHLPTRMPQYISNTMTITANTAWAGFYPMPIGSHTYFSYAAHAGKGVMGVQVMTSPTTGKSFTNASFTDVLRGQYVGGAYCNNAMVNAAILGAPYNQSFDWVLISGVADLDGVQDSDCTVLSKMIEVTIFNDQKPSSPKGIMTFKLGK